jgi:hypothetical protein
MNGPRHRRRNRLFGRARRAKWMAEGTGLSGEVNEGGLIGCSKGRRARDGNPFQTALSRRATAQVGQVVHAELCGGLSEPHSAGGEESAEEAT